MKHWMQARGWLRRSVGIIIFAGLCASALVGCKKNQSLGETVTPQVKQVADVRPTESVYVIASKGEPLIVDWQPESRGDLEVAMRQGVAVVSFSERGLRLLKDCRVSGDYGFVGMNKKEQVVRLTSKEEVKANLPFNGLGLMSQIGADFGQSSVIEIALVMVGKARTTWTDVRPEDLSGDCAGATHFVRGATVGAFAVQSGSAGRAASAVEVFGVGAGGAAEGQRAVLNRDGSLAQCAEATPSSKQAPDQCGALIRLELKAIAASTADDPRLAGAEGSEARCPAGFVFASGKCARASDVDAHVCTYGDVIECSVQCDQGNMESCDLLGGMFLMGETVKIDRKKALAHFQRACAAGVTSGCHNLGYMIQQGWEIKQDDLEAAQLYAQACRDGNVFSCYAEGNMFYFGRGYAVNHEKALEKFSLACQGGEQNACNTLGFMALSGIGMAKDERSGALFFKRACDGGVAMGCSNLAYIIEFGRGVQRDDALAAATYQKACRHDAAECVWVGMLHHAGIGGVSKSLPQAANLYAAACETGIARAAQDGTSDALPCALANLFGGRRYQLDATDAQDSMHSWQKSCMAGVERDCTLAGVLVTAFNGVAEGKPIVQKACQMRDVYACALLETAPFL